MDVSDKKHSPRHYFHYIGARAARYTKLIQNNFSIDSSFSPIGALTKSKPEEYKDYPQKTGEYTTMPEL